MTPDQIVAALTPVGKTVPTEALAAAGTQRAELTPRLLASLAELSAHPGNPQAIDLDRQLPFFAMYLLAAWRERRAHPLLLAFLRLPGDECIDLSGNIVHEDMDRMLAQTAGDDPAEIVALLRDPAANIWGRSAALRALGAMTQWGALPKAELAARCRELLAGLSAPPDHDDASYLFGTIVDCVMQHGLHELRDAVLATAELEWIDPGVAGDRADLEAEFAQPASVPPVEPIDDVAAEIGWWGCFQQDKPARPLPPLPADLPPPPPDRADEIPQPYRAAPKVGRNDPCPCGSGKKYKKCCGA